MILLVLPPPGAPIDAAATQHIQKIEKILLDRHSLAAVAFANETPDLAVLIERLRQDGKGGVPIPKPGDVPCASNVSLNSCFCASLFDFGFLKRTLGRRCLARDLCVRSWLHIHTSNKSGSPRETSKG